jgi:hypothetical protein
MQYTTEHPWDKIIVDAFVPLEKNACTTRILYEDDGLSPEYQKDAFRKTPVTMLRDEESFQLVIDKSKGTFQGAISSRDWVVRLNLPQNCSPKNIKVNGKNLEPGSSADITLVSQTELQEAVMPFIGMGSKPRTSAGPILELIIHQIDVLEPILISCKLK